MKLTTAADIKDYPGIPANVADGFIDKLIDRASAYVEKKTGRRFGVGVTVGEGEDAAPQAPYEATDESHTAANWGGFYLTNNDVREITSVKVGANQAIWTDDDYNFEARTNRFYLGRGVGDEVLVSYTYGYEGIPDDIKYATEALVIAMYQSLGGKGAVNSERTGNYQISYNTSKITMPNTPPDVEEILKHYRIIHI